MEELLEQSGEESKARQPAGRAAQATISRGLPGWKLDGLGGERSAPRSKGQSTGIQAGKAWEVRLDGSCRGASRAPWLEGIGNQQPYNKSELEASRGNGLNLQGQQRRCL